MCADAPRTPAIQPNVPVDEAKTVQYLGVTNIVPVAGLLVCQAVEQLFVLLRRRYLVVVVAVLEPDGDSMWLCGANEFLQRLLRAVDVRLCLGRAPFDCFGPEFREPRFVRPAAIEHLPHLEFLLKLLMHVAYLPQ